MRRASEIIEARIAAGESLTVAQIDEIIAADPVTTAAFATLNRARKAGADITLEDVERRTGFSVGFLQAAELARIHNTAVVGVHLVREGSVN